MFLDSICESPRCLPLYFCGLLSIQWNATHLDLHESAVWFVMMNYIFVHTLTVLSSVHAQRGGQYLVCVCVFVSVTQHLTFQVIIRATNDTNLLSVENFKLTEHMKTYLFATSRFFFFFSEMLGVN